ncbi:MAG: P-loop NTPase [Planctomycetota bacterium]|jgi:ATP-binding protein involved in chromosome partitioning
MIDPRVAAVETRFADVKRIVAVTGGKGGIGKSLISSALAVALARAGKRTGLFDLDLTGPSDHLLLGVDCGFPSEQFGIDPLQHHGIGFMSIAHFAGETPAPLRGDDITNALLELLAITRWGALDVLVIDMPPGLGDATLDAMRLLRRAEFLVVTTPSRVVREVVRRTLRFLSEQKAGVIGVVENMASGDDPASRELALDYEVGFLGSLPFDDTVEAACGDVERLAATPFFGALAPVASRL